VKSRGDTRRFAIVGGGFTAAAFIIHAVRAMHERLEFEVIEPAAELGRGVAYSTTDPLHRINVPTDRMSLVPDEPEHATRWLFGRGFLPGDGSSKDGSGAYYVPRWHYGSYVQDVLAETVREAGERVRLRHHRCLAEDVTQGGRSWEVRLHTGPAVTAEDLVLAFGHSMPGLPFAISKEALAHRGMIANPWHDDALRAIDVEQDVLIVGTGLTMADMAETLLRRGHRGRVVAVSRRGLLAQPQGLFRADDFLRGAQVPETALGLLRLSRERFRAADAQGLGWQVAADALRFQLAEIWPSLPVKQKAKIVNRLLPFWDTHRFRIAPQPGSTLREGIASGQIVILKGKVAAVDRSGRELVASLQIGGLPAKRAFGAAILCTGPSRNLAANPFVRRLLDRGIARLDALEMGLDVTARSQLVAVDGSVQESALALGPMTRGTFGEMTGAPDIVRHLCALTRSLSPSRPRRRWREPDSVAGQGP
jgi:uncharacterized NAD(P)/FAD-binding protein YdhS